ncbi:MAG TPA: SpoIIE family protein phosphatase [Thermoanaerobaculia bacterium]|nr:SpoIIE family protein phosphatase [Thermoanaerobaculia bacterium]
MPTRQDWKALAKETYHALDQREVKDLYEVEWRKAVRVFLSEHRDEIEGEKVRWKRGLRRANAVLFGITRKLTPGRRLLLVFAILFTLLGIVSFGSVASGGKQDFLYVVLAVLLLFVLVALELVDKLHFRDELLLARDLQADLVPQTLPETPAFELAGFNRVANTVGGDLYDFVPLPDGRLAVLFGDASGHGMSAGLIMAVTQAGFRTQISVDPSPPAVAAAINALLCRTGACRTSGPRNFFAGVVMLLAPDGSWSAVVAGHPPVVKLGPDGRVVETIGVGAYPLGVRATAHWPLLSGGLAPGGTLLFHSDGVVEVRNAAGEEFGDARLAAILSRRAGASANELVGSIAATLLEFLGRNPPDDDVSIAAIRRRMPAS